MTPSFILGNDYAVQYLLSLIRDRDRSYIKLGRSKETIEVQELRSESLLDLEGNSRHIEVDVNKVLRIPTKTSKRTRRTNKKAPEGTIPVRNAKEVILLPEHFIKVDLRKRFSEN